MLLLLFFIVRLLSLATGFTFYDHTTLLLKSGGIRIISQETALSVLASDFFNANGSIILFLLPMRVRYKEEIGGLIELVLSNYVALLVAIADRLCVVVVKGTLHMFLMGFSHVDMLAGT